MAAGLASGPTLGVDQVEMLELLRQSYHGERTRQRIL